MGMYDDFIPDPPLRCPVDEAELDGWQGKDGPCALTTYRQGDVLDDIPRRADHGVGDDWEASGPFELYTGHDERGVDHWVEAHGVIVGGRWAETHIDRVTHGIDGEVVWTSEVLV